MVTVLQVTPLVRSKFVSPDGREWTELGLVFGEWMEERPWPENYRIYTTGTLNRKQCLAFWHWLGRIDPCPQTLTIYVNNADFERAFPWVKGK